MSDLKIQFDIQASGEIHVRFENAHQNAVFPLAVDELFGFRESLEAIGELACDLRDGVSSVSVPVHQFRPEDEVRLSAEGEGDTLDYRLERYAIVYERPQPEWAMEHQHTYLSGTCTRRYLIGHITELLLVLYETLDVASKPDYPAPGSQFCDMALESLTKPHHPADESS